MIEEASLISIERGASMCANICRLDLLVVGGSEHACFASLLLFHQIFVERNEAGVNLELGSLVEEADMCTIFRLLSFQLSGLPDIFDVEVFFTHW